MIESKSNITLLYKDSTGNTLRVESTLGDLLSSVDPIDLLLESNKQGCDCLNEGQNHHECDSDEYDDYEFAGIESANIINITNNYGNITL